METTLSIHKDLEPDLWYVYNIKENKFEYKIRSKIFVDTASIIRIFQILGWNWGAKTTKSTGKAVTALYEVFTKDLGFCSKPKSRFQTMGNRKNDWTDVERITRF